jgi:transcriptional regulator with XRE-family HTH domain
MGPETSDPIGSAGSSPAALRRRLGKRAREARLAAGRSQADVAGAAGISVPTLGRFEAGSNVSVDALVRVTIALNADRELDALFALPDARTIDEILRRRALPQRGRSK